MDSLNAPSRSSFESDCRTGEGMMLIFKVWSLYLSGMGIDLNAVTISSQNSFSGCLSKMEYRELRWYLSISDIWAVAQSTESKQSANEVEKCFMLVQNS